MKQRFSARVSLGLTLASIAALSCAALLSPTRASATGAPAVKVVALPAKCVAPWAAFGGCKPDASFELAFEKEYWARVGTSDVAGMGGWLPRAADYLSVSKTPRAARLTTLVAAGYVMVYRSHALFDAAGLPVLLNALSWAEKAHKLAPDSPNTGSFYYFLRAYRQFGLSDWTGGMKSLDTLLGFPGRYGLKGSEGEVVAALGLGLLTHTDQAQRTLDILKDCSTPNCQRTSSLAPFKVIGMHMAIAESYAKVGDETGMQDSLDRARALATKLKWPFATRIDELEDELTRPGGLVDQWTQGKDSIGYVQLPLPPSAGVASCSGCHVGAKIPAGIY